MMQLLGQRAMAVAEYQPGHRKGKGAVLRRQLLRGAHEDTAGAIEQRGLAAGGDDAHDQVLQLLAITGLVFVPDHQVQRQALLPPIGMGKHHLLDQVEVGRVSNLYQHDRQVPRQPLAPQPGLAATVADQKGATGPQRGVGVDHRRGHLLEQPGIVERPVELTQLHLAMWPGEVEHPVGQVAIAVLGDLLQAGIAAVSCTGDQVDRGFLARRQADAAADRHDRVEYRPGAVGQGLGLAVQCRWGHQGAATAYETGAVGFVGDGIDIGAMHGQHMAHPRHCVLLRARPPGADNGLQRADQFGLHEQLAERRVQGIAQGRCQHHLGVAGQLQGALFVTMIGQVQASQFDVVLGRNGYFGMAVEVAFTDAEFGAAITEYRLLVFAAVPRRLVGS
ncbi:hypothetical protein D3C81_608940 [compost metagenome]